MTGNRDLREPQLRRQEAAFSLLAGAAAPAPAS